MKRKKILNLGGGPVIVVAVIVTFIIYLAGVFSGLYANKIIEKKVSQDMEFLKNYVDSSSLDLKNILLLQIFMDKVENKCEFSDLYLANLKNQLQPYWQKLPKRLEEYEKSGVITDEYIALKREYIRLSLRIWLVAQNNYRNCNTTNFIPLLYFYSKDCKTCVEQGEILDSFNKEGKYSDKNVIVFPVDGYFEDDTVHLLRQYYNISTFPAIVINDRVFQKQQIPLADLLEAMKGYQNKSG